MAITVLQKDRGLKLLVVQAVHEALTDPDFGLVLRENAKKKLRVSRRQKKTIPFAAIQRKYA